MCVWDDVQWIVYIAKLTYRNVLYTQTPSSNIYMYIYAMWIKALGRNANNFHATINLVPHGKRYA